MRFSINCYLSREKPLVKHMAPGSIFHHITFRSTILVSYLLSLQSFTFRYINQKYLKYYFIVYPSLSDLTLQITVKGLTTPLSRWVQVFVCYVGTLIGDLCVPPTGLIPWFLTEGNTYLYFAASPFPLQGKNQRKLKN